MDTVICLQGNSRSPLTPLFLIHAISGLALPYFALGSLSDDRVDSHRDRPIYGITSPIFSNKTHRAPSSIDEVAGHYVSIIRRVQPEGPYLLGGWSFGGMIAMKMASVLEELGERVLRVIMIDSANPDRFPAFINRAEHEKITAITYNNVTKRMNIPASLAEDDSSESSSEEDDDDDDSSLSNMLPKMRNHIYNGLHLIAKENRFHEEVCRAPVTLIKCSTLSRPSPSIRDARKEFVQKTFMDERMGWPTNSFSRFHTVEISGSHDSVFDRGNVDELTKILKSVLKVVR